MKLESTNVYLTANEKMGLATLGQNDKGALSGVGFIDEKHLEELRDLIDLYLELKKKGEI
jgi:hypothetical protein|tara:strand:- start:1767 stop:1946 length:180 start_codon:yes stop_codon:yes gene_type:complete